MKTPFKRTAYITGFLGLAVILVTVTALIYASLERREHESATSVGAEVYAQNCASCHGAGLEGENDWQTPYPNGIFPAPPHDESGHTWHHSDRLLLNYIKFGGAEALAQDGVTNFKSGMPAFENTLNDDQIAAVIAFIKSGWSREIRQIQQGRTETDDLSGE